MVFNSNYEKYAEKEIFLDLYELMKEDEDISKNDIFPCVLNSLEYNGHLYAAAPYFRIKTLVGKESNIPIKTDEIWDGRALIELNSSLSENQRLTAAKNREYFTNMLLMYSAGAYIDFDNNKCDFGNEDFISLLKYINDIPEGNDLAEDFGKTGIYRNDTCLLYSATLCNIPDYFAVKYRFGIDELLNFVGYPSPDGGKSVVAPYNYYAISSESAVREGAWEFIKFLMTEYLTLNSSDMNSNIPTLKPFFNKWVEMQQSYKYIPVIFSVIAVPREKRHFGIIWAFLVLFLKNSLYISGGIWYNRDMRAADIYLPQALCPLYRQTTSNQNPLTVTERK